MQFAPSVGVVDLFHDVPNYSISCGSHLLAALLSQFPLGSVFLCVVAPGVGSDRDCIVVEVDGYWFVGPDNGLFSILAARAKEVHIWSILINYARFLAEVEPGQHFWYKNNIGLVEMAVNKGNAATTLPLCIGQAVAVI